MNTATANHARSNTGKELDRARLSADVSLAGAIISRSWPLENFIAVNPLAALENMEFSAAVKKAGGILGAGGTLREEAFRKFREDGRINDSELLAALRSGYPDLMNQPLISLGGKDFDVSALLLQDLLSGTPLPDPVRENRMVSELSAPTVADQVDEQTSKWCSAFLDESQSAWNMPGREHGFYAAWRDLAPRDRTLPGSVRRSLESLPETADDALLEAISRLGISLEDQRAFLQAHLTRMPGWAAHIRWREEHSDALDLVAYLAMRASYEAALLEDIAPQVGINGQSTAVTDAEVPTTSEERAAAIERSAVIASALGVSADTSQAELAELSQLLSSLPAEDRRFVWLEAYESRYQNNLIEQLASPDPAPATETRAQIVCCIDVRSEGLRRWIEATGPYETLGFAGFFAVAIQFQNLAGGQPTSLCPVLLEPKNRVSELPAPGKDEAARKQVSGQNSIAAAEDSFHAAETHPVSPFVLAEATGWAKGPLAATKTVFSRSYSNLRGRLKESTAPPAPTVIDVEDGFSLEERVMFAQVSLGMMGLTRDFARLVVLCGHGSTTENNPYESALDCGACGGNRGAPNARTAAAILNGTGLRKELAAQGIQIPEDTWFIAGEHDTATDRVTLLDPHLVPATHDDDLRLVSEDLETACAGLSSERCESLPGAPSGPTLSRASRHAEERASDWAQVFPEWGLAGNAAFIIGPRSMTRGLNLERRAFLHSYDAADDTGGEALETILTAPLVVAQWISSQYYFSTVDPVVFGSGSKVIHNVVGGFGVMAGYGGDLQMGLPWQSVADGDRLVHEPMRLMAVAQAPLDRIDSVIDRNPLLQDLFGNGWLALAARDSENDPWMKYQKDGWQPWNTPEENK